MRPLNGHAYIALSHLVLVRIQERQGTSEHSLGVCGGKVVDFDGEVLVVQPIVVGRSGEPLSVSLQAVHLLYLAAIGQRNVVDTEVSLIVVTIRGDLT